MQTFALIALGNDSALVRATDKYLNVAEKSNSCGRKTVLGKTVCPSGLHKFIVITSDFPKIINSKCAEEDSVAVGLELGLGLCGCQKQELQLQEQLHCAQRKDKGWGTTEATEARGAAWCPAIVHFVNGN